MASWPVFKNYLDARHAGLALALLIVLWSPFIGGPRLPSLLLALLGGWFLWKERALIFSRPAARRFGLIFLLLWLPVLASLPGSLNPRRSLEIALVLPVYFFTGLALIEVLRADRARRRLAQGIALVLLAWIGDGLIQYFLGRDLIGIPLTPDGRVVGFFADNLRLGAFSAMLLPVLLWLAGPRWWLSFALLALTGLIVVLSGVRMSLVMLAVAAAVLFARLPRRYLLPAAAAIAAVVIGATALSPAMQERLERVAVTRLDFETVDRALSGRLFIWETAGYMVGDRPLTGVGAGAFGAAYDRYATRAGDVFVSGREGSVRPYHAHQMYVSIAAESGLIGFGAILAAFGLVVRWYRRAPRARRDQAWPWAWALLVAVFPVNSQPVLYTHWWLPVLLLLLCASLAALDPTADPPEQHEPAA